MTQQPINLTDAWIDMIHGALMDTGHGKTASNRAVEMIRDLRDRAKEVADEQRTADFYFRMTMVLIVLLAAALTAIAVLTYPGHP